MEEGITTNGKLEEWMSNSSPSSQSKSEEQRKREAQTTNIIVEDIHMNNFHIDVELEHIISRLISNSEQIEHIIPRMVLDSFIKRIDALHNRNKKLLIKLWKNN